jgi:hypothetical protein
MNSFLPIIKTLEALAILDEHCKARRQTPLADKREFESFDSMNPNSMGSTQTYATNLAMDQHNCMPHLSPKSTGKTGKSGVKQELEPFSTVDSFYAFKAMLIDSNYTVHESLLKTLFAVETKKVQTFLYKDQMLGRVLLEKAEIKKCYQYTQ